jgi:transitional endoplasmic reticulum ATPase
MSTRVAVVEPPASLPPRRIGVPPSVCAALGVDTGDLLSVTGEDRTAAVVERVGADHQGVCLGSSLCEGADVSVGDSVALEREPPVTAEAVRLRLDRSLSLTRVEESLRRRLTETAVTVDDAVTVSHLDGALTLRFVVDAVEPSSPAIVEASTDLDVVTDDDPDAVAVETSVADPDRTVPRSTYRRLRDIVATRLDEASTFTAAGRPASVGILLSGPRGAGKTSLVEAVAAATAAEFVPVSTAALRAASSTDRRDRLDRVVATAREADRCVVLFDDLEVLGNHGTGSSLGGQLREPVDELRATDGTVVVGATTDPGSVPEALRRGGRFDREIALDHLTGADRRDALELLTRDVPLAADVDLEATAIRISGFVLADVAAVVDAALERAVRRTGESTVAQADLDHAIDEIEPTGLRTVSLELPSVSLDDVGGLSAAKREIVRTVYWPLAYADRFERAGIEPPSGVLLYGPPGTGKTLLARAAAGLSDANFISVNGPELLDRYVGESERAIRELFATARESAPAVVFFDEVDAISSARRGDDTGVGERVVSQLLTELDGLEPLTDVVVVAATNRPETIDEALLRPGRIETAVETPLPDRTARREILAIHTRETPLSPDVDLDDVARRTAGYSGGDLAALVREAAMLAIETTLTDGTAAADPAADVTVGRADVERALEETEPSVSADGRWDVPAE